MSQPKSNLPMLIVGFLILALGAFFGLNLTQQSSSEVTAQNSGAESVVEQAQEAAGEAAQDAAKVAEQAAEDAKSALAPAAGSSEPAKQ